MADAKGTLDPKKDLLYILLGLVALFIIWLFTGGPERYKTAKPFLNSGSYNEGPTEYGDDSQ